MSHYDVIIVGARCAGSPTAMLLARKGYKVLLVDKASFPSDTISTHLIHTPGVAALKRWGLLDRVAATGCPPIDTYAFDFGPFTISGSPAIAEAPVSYAPRRTVLDKVLVDAAAEAKAEVREEFTVEGLLFEDNLVTGIRGRAKGGKSVKERARVVVGADGRHSTVAEAVRAEAYNEKPPILAGYYTYWSGLPMDGRFEAYVGDGQSFAACPTNDGLTLVVCGWNIREFEARKKDIEGNYHKVLAIAPKFAERVAAAKREERFVGTPVANWFRKPFGPGWALVGDAGYNKDYITAQGISDAFRDAELCVEALDRAYSTGDLLKDTMGVYQATRDRHVLAIYEYTYQLASQDPPPPEMKKILYAVSKSQEARDGFARVQAGATSPAEFFSEENVGRIFASAGAA